MLLRLLKPMEGHDCAGPRCRTIAQVSLQLDGLAAEDALYFCIPCLTGQLQAWRPRGRSGSDRKEPVMATAEPARAPVTRAQLDEAIRRSADLEIQFALDGLADLGLLTEEEAERVERYLVFGRHVPGEGRTAEDVLRDLATVARLTTSIGQLARLRLGGYHWLRRLS